MAAAGTYTPTVQPVPLPVTYTGFGFFATNLSVQYLTEIITGPGGIIKSPNTVTINTTGATNAYGAWSDGTGAQINFSGSTTISTTGTHSSASMRAGRHDFGDRASDDHDRADEADGVLAYTGGAVTLNGGSITTTENSIRGLRHPNGGSTSITTRTS